jgi:chromosome partitioning protein
MISPLSDNLTILVGGEKGGTGKSTIATNLAIMLKIAGFDTHLVDCDRQKTALRLATRRTASQMNPTLVATHLSGDQLQVPLADLSEKYDAVIIDCGGQDSVELRSAMISPSVSLMIIPIQAGYFDIETLVHMNGLVSTSKIYHPKLKAKCLINRAPTHSLITVTQEAKQFINDDLDQVGLFETVLHDRVNYGYAVAQGQCVAEYEIDSKRNNKATREMCRLFLEITGKEFPLSKITEFNQTTQEQEVLA